MREPETPVAPEPVYNHPWHDRNSTISGYRLVAQTHIKDNGRFVKEIITDRDSEKYPDPYERNIFNKEIIQRYLNRLDELEVNYVPKDVSEAREIDKFISKERERFSEQIKWIEQPTPDTYGYDFDTVFYDIASGVENKDIDTVRELFQTPLKHLQKLSKWFKYSEWRANNTEIDVIRYIRGDENVGFKDMFSSFIDENIDRNIYLEDTGEEVEPKEGVSIDTIKEEIDSLIREHNEFVIALGLMNINKISYYTTEHSNGGRATTGGKMEVETQTVEWEDGESWNTVAHELFHHISYALDHYVPMQSRDNEKLFIAETDPNIDRCQLDETYSHIMDTMVSVWSDYCENRDKFIRNYQKKNMDELFALGFEVYHEEPERLKEEQPEVYEVIDKMIMDIDRKA